MQRIGREKVGTNATRRLRGEKPAKVGKRKLSKEHKKKVAKVKYSKKEIENIIVSLWKENQSLSRIGAILRDKYGVNDVKKVLGKKLGHLLAEKGFRTYPEDLKNLIKKAEKIKKHMEVHKQDKHSKHRYEIVLSKIKRLSDYYIREGVISERPSV